MSFDEDLHTGGIKGKDAVFSNIAAALSLADQIKTTYGPHGRDKLIFDKKGNITITNDGATLLRLLEPKHPVSQLLVKLSRTQDNEVGDGTTGVVLLACALLSEAKQLIQLGYHTQTIIQGYKKGMLTIEHVYTSALNIALLALEKAECPLDDTNTTDVLRKILHVPLNSKLLHHDQEFFTNLLLEAKNTITKNGNAFTMDSIHIVAIPSGSLTDSFLVDGVVFQRTFTYAGFEQQPKIVHNPKILLLNHEIELKHQKEFAHLSINTPNDYASFIDTEWDLVYRKLDQIYDSQCTVPIGDLATQHFVQHKITNISRVPYNTMDLVQKTVGGTIYSTMEQNLNDLGSCELFQDKTIGDDRYCILSGCKNPKHVTLVLRGSSEEVLQEAHRSIHDAICILANAIENPSFIVGGGAIEFMLKNKIEEYCMKQSITSQRAFALNSCIQAFGKALIYNAITLCENGCLNVAQVVQELEMLHKHETNRYYGVDIERGCAGDLYAMSIFEPTIVKRNALMCAVEAACLILSIDYVIKMPQEETEEQKGVRLAKEHRQQQLAQRQWKQTSKAQQKDLV